MTTFVAACTASTRHSTPDKQLDGDLRFNNDFRSLYSSVLDQWMDMSPDADRKRHVRPVRRDHQEAGRCVVV